MKTVAQRKAELCARIQQITFELKKLGGVYASCTPEYQKLFLEREQLHQQCQELEKL